MQVLRCAAARVPQPAIAAWQLRRRRAGFEAAGLEAAGFEPVADFESVRLPAVAGAVGAGPTLTVSAGVEAGAAVGFAGSLERLPKSVVYVAPGLLEVGTPRAIPMPMSR